MNFAETILLPGELNRLVSLKVYATDNINTRNALPVSGILLVTDETKKLILMFRKESEQFHFPTYTVG